MCHLTNILTKLYQVRNGSRSVWLTCEKSCFAHASVMEIDGDNDFNSLPVPQKRRHYKKDSRFVFDLYTLCYDENESVDTVELFTSIVNNTAADNWYTSIREFHTRCIFSQHHNTRVSLSANLMFNWYSMTAVDQPPNIMFSFNFIRGILLLFNLLLWFAGLLIILTGIWLQTDFENYLKISNGYSIYVPYLLLVAGGILVFAASLACSCIVKVDPTMLVIYGGFLIGAMFTLILMSIYIYGYKDNVITGLPAGIKRELKNYDSFQSITTRGTNKSLIDYVQNNLECCGGSSHLDWPKDSLPNSCCWDRGDNKNCSNYQLGRLHEVGCLPKLIRLINTNLTSIGVMLSVLALFPLFAMVFSYSLASATRRLGYQSIG